MTRYGYHPIEGSAWLKTRAKGIDSAVDELESLDPSAPSGRSVDGQWLARATVRSDYVPVLFAVFDRLLPGLSPLAGCAYLQLYRLSFGEERNWCRTSRRELRDRTGLSDRRLGAALAELVTASAIALVHRDRQGTLYRVFLPHEILGEPHRDRVLMPKAPRADAQALGAPKKDAAAKDAAAKDAAAKDAAAMRAVTKRAPTKRARTKNTAQKGPPLVEPPAGPPSAVRAPRAAAIAYKNDTVSKSQLFKPPTGRMPKARLTVGLLAAQFTDTWGGKGRGKVEVVEEILSLLEEGHDLADIANQLNAFGTGAPRGTPIAELSRWLARKGLSG